MKNKHAISISTAMIVCIIIHFFCGFYFEAYEHLYNYITLSSIETNKVFDPITDNDFLLLQLYGYLQIFLPGIEIFSIGKVLFLGIGISAIVFIILNYFKDNYVRVFILFGFLSILLESFILISTVRISFLLGFSAIAMLLTYYNKLRLKHIFIFYLFGVFCIMQRNEIGLLVFTIGSCVGLLFNKKKLLIHSLIIASLAIASYQFMTYYNYHFHHYAYSFLDNEREIIHQNNLKINYKEIESIISGNSSDEKTLKILATAFFLMDEPLIDYKEIKEYVRYQSMYEYIFNNNNFLKYYISNLNSFKSILIEYYLYLVIAYLSLSVYGFFIAFKRRQLLKTLLLFCTVNTIPFLLCAFLAVPERLIAPYISLLTISIVFYLFNSEDLNRKKNKVAIISAALFLIVTGACQFYFDSINKINNKKNEEKFAEYINSDFHKNETKRPIVLSLLSWKLIPVKLFSTIYPNNKMPPFISLSFYDFSSTLSKQKEIVFGNDYQKLPSRFEFVIKENNGILYGSDIVMNFTKSYLKELHNYQIDFKVIEDFKAVQNENGVIVNKYKVEKLN